MNIVVGSGPAGIACARALLDAGQPVTMIDAGIYLEPERQAAKARLAARDPALWRTEDLAFLRSPARPGAVPDKTSFGSDFPYRPFAGATPAEWRGASLKPSHATAGLSTVWGGAMLPYRDEDLRGWPLRTSDFAASYAAAVKLMPMAAAADDLEPMFPLHGTPGPALPLSSQARTLMRALIRHRGPLAQSGLVFGRARLAVDAPPCNACGFCLQGCPYDLIGSTRPELERLRADGMAYHAGVLVRSVAESGAGVVVHARDAGGGAIVFEGTRVFLGAGVINTAEIMLRSRGGPDQAVTIRDSQYFLMPALLMRGSSHVETERLTTLAQIFIELTVADLSPFTIHLQAYTYSEILRDTVLARAGRWRHLLPLGAIFGRLILLQGYLHSAHSGTIEARLAGQGGGEKLVLTGRANPAAARLVNGIARTLTGLAHRTGLIPLRQLTDVTLPGRGFHAGGTFPMARNPGPNETDIAGRPVGMARVHLVDSSVFPSIPATTITLSVMANAYRIGSAAALGGL